MRLETSSGDAFNTNIKSMATRVDRPKLDNEALSSVSVKIDFFIFIVIGRILQVMERLSFKLQA